MGSVKLSDFGRKMTAEAGILQLMDDLGKALADKPPIAMFGGGNPAQIPAVTKAFKESMQYLLDNPKRTAAMLGNYDTPRGNAQFITTMKDYLNRHYNLGISEDNIAITPGSQSGYFMLFNLLAGKTSKDGGTSLFGKILFPLVPEYIGYVDQALELDAFASVRPKIEKLGGHEFKYQIDFDVLAASEDVAAICLSRPTNPSGNVVTDEELEHLGQIAVERDIPLLIDNAYGLPFPGVITPDAHLFWSKNTVLSFSLSKIGLPSSRVGIFVGPADLMQALSSANAIMNLASPGIGQYLAQPLIASDEIDGISQEHIRPYYSERAKKARALIDNHFPKSLPWRLHKHEGAYFFWLWCEGANLSSWELYNRLKTKGVLVVPGEYFFPGQVVKAWPHAKECLRINFARPDSELKKGIPILAEAIKAAYL